MHLCTKMGLCYIKMKVTNSYGTILHHTQCCLSKKLFFMKWRVIPVQRKYPHAKNKNPRLFHTHKVSNGSRFFLKETRNMAHTMRQLKNLVQDGLANCQEVGGGGGRAMALPNLKSKLFKQGHFNITPEELELLMDNLNWKRQFSFLPVSKLKLFWKGVTKAFLAFTRQDDWTIMNHFPKAPPRFHFLDLSARSAIAADIHSNNGHWQ